MGILLLGMIGGQKTLILVYTDTVEAVAEIKEKVFGMRFFYD